MPNLAIRYRYWLTALLSLLASFILINQRELVNADAVVYLASARALLDGDMQAAFSISPNILLPALIAVASKVANGNLILAADTINTLLFMGLSLAFVWLVSRTGASTRAQAIAGLLIILHPSLSGFRDTIFRDSAYWMACLSSLGLLLNWEQQRSLPGTLLWWASLVLAALFRPEATFLMAAPFALLFTRGPALKQRLGTVVVFYLPLLIAAAGLSLVLLAAGGTSLVEEGVAHLSRYFENGRTPFVLQLPEGITSLFAPYNPMSDAYPENALWAGTILLLIPVAVSALLGAISTPFVLLYIWVYWRGERPQQVSGLFWAYCGLSLLVILAFTLLTGFQTTRYCTLLSLLLLALLPTLLERTAAGIQRRALLRGLTLAGLLVLAVDTFISFGYSRAYLPRGMAWVDSNTPAEARIMSNERNIAWTVHGRKEFSDTQAVFGNWRRDPAIAGVLANYDYFVEDVFWELDPWLPELLPAATEIHRETSERGNRLIVYRLPAAD